MDTIFTQLVNAGNGPVIRDGVDHATRPASSTFPYLARAQSRTRPSHPSTTERWTAVTTVTADGSVLELDDIQAGALHERPSPYVGTYLLLRIDDRAAGRELVRRLHRRRRLRPAVRAIPRTTPGSRSRSPTTA